MPNSSPIQLDSKYLDKEIISTLLFYQLLNVPCLTVFEIYKYLNSVKLKTQNTNLANIYSSLNDNAEIKSKNGFYWLNESDRRSATGDQQYENRILAAKISAQKIKKAKKVARLLKFIPFVKSIVISGSVSMDAAKPKSDIDLFIISQKNRIWLARLATVFLTQIIGQRRHKEIINDKICLNIYVADEQSEYPIKNHANAQMISRSFPVYNKKMFSLFLSANKNWLGEYIENFERNFLIKRNFINYKQQTISYKLVDFFENLICKILSKRISRNSPDAKPPFLVITNNALLFHYPRSKNVEVMEKYEKSIAEYENKN